MERWWVIDGRGYLVFWGSESCLGFWIREGRIVGRFDKDGGLGLWETVVRL